MFQINEDMFLVTLENYSDVTIFNYIKKDKTTNMFYGEKKKYELYTNVIHSRTTKKQYETKEEIEKIYRSKTIWNGWVCINNING